MVKTSSGVMVRPRGFVSESLAGRSGSVGDYLAELVHWKRSSFRAWAKVAKELHTRRAPVELVEGLVEVVSDQMRHTDALLDASQRFDGGFFDVIDEVAAEAGRQRLTPLELAVTTAVRGCVLERYGALEAEHQAMHATDARLRSLFRVVATDARRHAWLFSEVGTWLAQSLDHAASIQVEDALSGATFELAIALSRDASSELLELAGLPSARDALALIADVKRECGLLAA